MISCVNQFETALLLLHRPPDRSSRSVNFPHALRRICINNDKHGASLLDELQHFRCFPKWGSWERGWTLPISICTRLTAQRLAIYGRPCKVSGSLNGSSGFGCQLWRVGRDDWGNKGALGINTIRTIPFYGMECNGRISMDFPSQRRAVFWKGLSLANTWAFPILRELWASLGWGKTHKFKNKPRVRREWRSLSDTMSLDCKEFNPCFNIGSKGETMRKVMNGGAWVTFKVLWQGGSSVALEFFHGY